MKSKGEDKSPSIEAHIKDIIEFVGEDPEREGLLSTPKRVVKSLQFLTQGYNNSVEQVLNRALFEAPENSSEMVIVQDIEIYSLCEHHMLPFFGKCHVGYLPRKKIIGLSKIPRLMDVFARRMQVQERLTSQLADCLMEVLEPYGVGVVIEARHFCMMMRGVEKQNSFAKTSALRGDFLKATTRAEFFNLIR